jgi:hypothetical protein
MPSGTWAPGPAAPRERFAKQNAEACFALELANAKDIQDVLAIQSRYAQTQMQT